MNESVRKRIADYLRENRNQLLDSWLTKIIDNSYGPEATVNGALMLDLVIACVEGDEINEKKLRTFATKIAQERLQANVNIGDFVYNVTVGRSVIFEQLPQIGVSIDELRPFIRTSDFLFDKFLYYAVHHYTELKNQVLTEQSSFIERSHKDKLTILGQMSSSFVHEFRNPLASVIGFVQLLQERHPNLEFLDIISKELEQLNFRITQYLLMSKKGGDQKKREIFQVVTVIDETLEFLYPVIASSNATIKLDIDNSIHLYGIRDEFRQVLINILMNSLDALSLSSLQEIGINAHTEDNAVILTISNTGPPIPDDMLTTIFEPFVSDKKLGTGLGLYLCRRIVTDHGGTIDCESSAELTTFRIRIPVDGEHQQPET